MKIYRLLGLITVLLNNERTTAFYKTSLLREAINNSCDVVFDYFSTKGTSSRHIELRV